MMMDPNLQLMMEKSSTINVAGTNEVNAVGGKISIELLFDQKMHALEDDNIFDISSDDKDDGAVADMNNLDTTIQVSPIPTTIIHKDHLIDQVIGDLQSATQTRKMSKNLEERGKIEEEVYVCQPSEFEDPDFPDKVYKVKKVLYRLHQAPKAWYETLSIYLLDNGFQREKIDKTLFIKRHKGDILLVQLNVDDIIFGFTKKELCIAFERLMHEKFQMSYMRILTFFLGLHVKQKKDCIFINQDKHVAKILKKFRFTEVKTVSTSMETQKPLLKDEDGEEVDVHMYRSMIGSLMYLISSRPGIMFAVCNVLDTKSIKRKPKRKDTQVPQPSNPIEDVPDEAVHKELGDSLVRATTTASSLEVKQDSGNINKTQSKATHNESSSQRPNSSVGPWCQETVLDLEKTTTTQYNEIVSLKRRVKKLEKKNRSRTHKLKRLYKVGLMARVESFGNKESLGEDASKQGRIDAIDVDEEITLVSVQDEVVSNDADKEMFDVDVLDGEEVFDVEHEVAVKRVNAEVNAVEEPIKRKDQIKLNEEATLKVQATFDKEERLAREKAKKKKRKHFAAKRAEEKRNKPPTKAQQRKIICTYLKNMEGYKLKYLKLKEFDSIQEMFDKAFKRVNNFEDFKIELVKGKEKRAGTELIQEITKKQKVEDEKEISEIKQLMEIIPDKEEVAIDAIPLSVKSPKIID
nr:uncharacterized mitochondrial protein AtMg00810-like [Tanacetum cinerariifolium]